jgi:hypothetical protein
VNWLRSKARHDRWEEEVGTLKSEMKWTTLFFDHEKKVWEERALMRGGDGHKAYAFRQAAMWEQFGTESRRIFGQYM